MDKSFSDRLRERSAFVNTQGANPLQNLMQLQDYVNSRAGYMNEAESQMQASGDKWIKEGSNGVTVNPSDIYANLDNFYGANTDRMDSLMALLQSANSSVLEDQRSREASSSEDPFKELKTLLDTRKAMVEAGKDTSTIDSALEAYGIGSDGKQEQEKAELLSLVDGILGSDTRDVTGIWQVPGMIPGTQAQNTRGMIDRLKSSISLEGRQKLRGQGTITDAEMKMLENASTMLNRQLSDKDLKAELNRIKQELGGAKPSAGKINGYTIEEVK